MPLFERMPHSVRVAPAARDLLATLTGALDEIDAGIRRLRSAAHPEIRLHVTATAAFAAGWLLPRVSAFHRHSPDVALTVSATEMVVDPTVVSEGGDIEGCVRLGRAGWRSEFGCDFLFLERRLPVCSRDYAERHALDPANEAPLDGQTLLEAIPLGSVWDEWHAAFDSPAPSSKRLVFGDERLAQEAAVAGLGIALADRTLVGEELSSGRLVAPLGSRELLRGVAWFFVYPESVDNSPTLARFRDWLQEAVGGEPM